MKKLEISKVPKNLKPDPVFAGLPEYLKDPKNYDKTEGIIKKLTETKHKHKTVSSYVKCKDCQAQYEERKKMMKEIGFSGAAQYMAWKKIMDIIINKRDLKLR